MDPMFAELTSMNIPCFAELMAHICHKVTEVSSCFTGVHPKPGLNTPGGCPGHPFQALGYGDSTQAAMSPLVM